MATITTAVSTPQLNHVDAFFFGKEMQKGQIANISAFCINIYLIFFLNNKILSIKLTKYLLRKEKEKEKE